MTVLAAGQRIADRYQLDRRIAVGGMGEVWEASDKRLGRSVAVKMLRPELAGDPEFLHRFRIEARTVASLDHSGIAAVHDYGETDGAAGRRTAYLVMELVRGEPLSTLIARGPIDADETLRLHRGGRVGAAGGPRARLRAPRRQARQHPRPHRRQVKLTDFGIAKAADAVPVTRSGMVMGTAHYIAPEQASGAEAGPGRRRLLAGHRRLRVPRRASAVPRRERGRRGDDAGPRRAAAAARHHPAARPRAHRGRAGQGPHPALRHAAASSPMAVAAVRRGEPHARARARSAARPPSSRLARASPRRPRGHGPRSSRRPRPPRPIRTPTPGPAGLAAPPAGPARRHGQPATQAEPAPLHLRPGAGPGRSLMLVLFVAPRDRRPGVGVFVLQDLVAGEPAVRAGRLGRTLPVPCRARRASWPGSAAPDDRSSRAPSSGRSGEPAQATIRRSTGRRDTPSGDVRRGMMSRFPMTPGTGSDDHPPTVVRALRAGRSARLRRHVRGAPRPRHAARP